MDEIIPFAWGEGFGKQEIPVIDLPPVTVNRNETQAYVSPQAPLPSNSIPSDANGVKQGGKDEIFPNKSSYTIWVEVLGNGSAVLDAYERKQPGPRDICFFCEADEANKSNLFGTFILVKYGLEYRTLLANLKEKKTKVSSRRKNKLEAVTIDSFEAEVRDNASIINNNDNVNVTPDQIKYAMEGELHVSDTNKKTLNDVFSWYNDGVLAIVEKVSDWMESAKFTRDDYQPPKSKPAVSEVAQSILGAAATGMDYLVPDAVEDFISTSFQTAFSTIRYLSKKALPQSWVNFLERVYGKVQEVLSFFKNVIKNIPDIVGEAFLLIRAVLMGFINGLLSTLQLLVSLCGWVMQQHQNDLLNGQLWRKFNSYLEFIEDTYDLIGDKISDFTDSVINLVKDFSIEKLESLWSVFADKLSDYNRYDYAYFAGSFVFEVVLSVVLAFFTGGATAVAEAANASEKAVAFLKLVAKEAFSTATGGIIDLFQLVRALVSQFIRACQKGWKGLKSFLKKLFSKGTEDLLEDDKLREKIDDLEDLINKVDKDGVTIKEIFITEIVEALTGITDQSTKVAEALSEGLIGKRILEDGIFEYVYRTRGGGNPETVSAFAYANFTYFRESTPAKVFFKELVHEGTHVLDDISQIKQYLGNLKSDTGKLMLQGESMAKYIKSLNREQTIEFRARFFEREFELATGSKTDFKSIQDMITYIKKNY